MRTGGKSALTVRGACLAAGLTFLLGMASAESSLDVSVSSEIVSITAHNTSIRSILEELSRHTNLTVISQEALDELVSVQLDRQKLSETVRRLLRQKSFMLHQLSYGAGSERAAAMSSSRLWVFPIEAGSVQHAWSAQPERRYDRHAAEDLINYQVLAYSNAAGERKEAMLGLGESDSSSAIAILQQGLSDQDLRVREAAVASLAELSGEQSVHALSIALHDPDAGLRIDAVDALGEIGGQQAIEFLQQAMTDENHTVREAAADWLTELMLFHD